MGAEIEHPALAGVSWPVIGVRVRREGLSLRAAFWPPAPQTVLVDVLLPCTRAELEGIARIAVGQSRARVYVRELGGGSPLLVLCLRGSPGAVRIEGPTFSLSEPLTAGARAAILGVAAVHRADGRVEEAQFWRVLARQILKARRSARRGRSVRTASAGLPSLGRC
ncbi:hypothetical protein [Streptomyces californicus]|uniref:hypothetical protein n=1 Tax=Streptomyces californicus TaxID=67351 RepID=UPI00296FC40B|nr:hypothetical protein [Streptomyces californicus]MDW4912492.1 hypothetical protein [Streptomyces californicus]